MDAYIIHIVILYASQISKLRPHVINPVIDSLKQFCQKCGGRFLGNFKYEFLLELNEAERKTAQMATMSYNYLKEMENTLFGFTILIARKKQNPYERGPDEMLLPGILQDNRLWIEHPIARDFSDYYEGEKCNRLFRVNTFLESGPGVRERLNLMLLRPVILRRVKKALNFMMDVQNDRNTLVLRGSWGAGKRSILQTAMESLFSEDYKQCLTITFTSVSEDPMESFARVLAQMSNVISLPGFHENMRDDEKKWWETEGENLLAWSRGDSGQQNFRDHAPVDIVQAISICLWAVLRLRKKMKKQTWLIIAGWPEEPDTLIWLRLIISECLADPWFRLIIIRDSEDFNASLPIPGKGHEIRFTRIQESELPSLMTSIGSNLNKDKHDINKLLKDCGSNLYKLFHNIISWEKNLFNTPVTEQLDEPTRLLFFLADASSGISTRQMLMTQSGSEPDEQFRQQARLETLLSLGLVREASDGLIQSLYFQWPGNPASPSHKSGNPSPGDNIPVKWRARAKDYGKYLFREYRNGEKINLATLFRYLEKWGPVEHALESLDMLFDEFLTQRRLRAASKLLCASPMANSELSGKSMESFQWVMSIARLRYSLLSSGSEKTSELVREGNITLISGQGSFADKALLNNSRFFYAVRQWEDALTAAKEALFAFQKSGNHEGQTYAHLEMALSYLIMGKISDARDHFGIASRVGSQLHPSWGVMRAAAMETVSFYIYGNLSRAAREATEIRKIASRHGRRDIWLLLTLLLIRIDWDLCHFRSIILLADEALKICDFYDIKPQVAVFQCWKGRAQLASSESAEASLLAEMSSSREANAFLAESAWNRGNLEKARFYIRKAASLPRRSTGLHGEADDWSDGFFPIEGRLSSGQEANREFLDHLGEWIEGFDAFLAARDGQSGQLERLKRLLERGRKQRLRPGTSLFAYWTAMTHSREDKELLAHYISQSFNALQHRASHFDDNQAKWDWLNRNPWNKLIMVESRNQKFAS